MVQASIGACDTDVKNLLYTNIVITGGNSLLPGFVDRLNYSLTHGVRAIHVLFFISLFLMISLNRLRTSYMLLVRPLKGSTGLGLVVLS
jgi:hypothetical protein